MHPFLNYPSYAFIQYHSISNNKRRLKKQNFDIITQIICIGIKIRLYNYKNNGLVEQLALIPINIIDN